MDRAGMPASRHLHAALLTAAAAAIVCISAAAASNTSVLQAVHVVFLTDCSAYSTWQSVGDLFSFRMSGQPGSMSRVMCCSPEDAKRPSVQALESEMVTWVAPSFAVHPRTGDPYLAYNKPEAVIDWLDHQTPEEEYVLVLDSDMLLRRPFLVEDMKPSPGWAISAKYTYMIGVDNALAERHIPEVLPRNDTLAGPRGRRADQVGGFFFIHRDDLKRMSHDWLRYTEDVRADPEAYRLTGDVYATKPGMKPWISEMYGYAFGAAKAGVWHKWDPHSMLYPSYVPGGIPKLMHYGLFFEVDGYKYDKHWHYGFDVTACPPWDFTDPVHAKAGIFAPPPRPSALRTHKEDKRKYYGDLLAIETVATLNAAFCDYHLRHCPPSQQMLHVCSEALDLYLETMRAIEAVEPEMGCRDGHPKCKDWAGAGECTKNYDYMRDNCAKACGECSQIAETAARPQPTETLAALDALRKTLATSAAASTPAGSGEAADPDQAAAAATPPTPTTPAATAVPVATFPPAPRAPSPPSPSTSAFRTPPPGETEDALVDGTEIEAAIGGERQAPSQEKRAAVAKKQLFMRCSRLALTIAEGKACSEAAAAGKTWERPGLGGGAGRIRTQTNTDAQGRKVRPWSTDDALEELRKLNEEVVAPAQNAKQGLVGGRVGHAGAVMAGGLTTWQAVGLWTLVLVLLLFAIPRLLRLRRRRRSGLRSE